MKKITLAERQKLMFEWATSETIVDKFLSYIKVPKRLRYDVYTIDDTEYVHYHCQECGWDADESFSRSNGYRRECPRCGANTNGYSEDCVLVEEHEGGWSAMQASVSLAEPDRQTINGDTWGWMKILPTINFHPDNAIRYDKEGGFVAYHFNAKCRWNNYRDEKFYRQGSYDFNWLVNQFTCGHNNFLNEGDFDIDFDTRMKRAQAEVDEAKSAKAVKPTKAKLLDDIRCNYVGKPLDFNKLGSKIVGYLSKQTGNIGGVQTYTAGCLNCGTIFEYDIKAGEEKVIPSAKSTCPCCGSKLEDDSYFYYRRYSNTEQTSTINIFENTDINDNGTCDVVLRLINCRSVLTKENGKFIIKKEFTETSRYFFGKKVTHFSFSTKKGVWEKERCDLNYLNRYSYKESINGQTNEEIAAVLANSFMRYSGAIEAMGLKHSPYKPIVASNHIDYIRAWYANPSIELIYKAGLYSMANNIIKYGNNEYRGKSITEMLGITPAALKIVRQADMSESEMRQFIELYKLDDRITAEDYEVVKKEGLNMGKLAAVLGYGITLKKALEYLNVVYMYQCIDKSPALNEWLDYLQMAAVLKYDLTDKDRKFPNSLKKEHDVAVFASRAINQNINEEQFAENARKNEELYGYHFEEFKTVFPQTPADVVQEATNQKNCLRAYINALAEGATTIAFVRYKECPDESYVTVEIKDNAITQLEGKVRTIPKNPKLWKFIEHWAKAKGLSVLVSAPKE